eukprot:2901826-Prymnesium_polylepis.1
MAPHQDFSDINLPAMRFSISLSPTDRRRALSIRKSRDKDGTSAKTTSGPAQTIEMEATVLQASRDAGADVRA